MGFGSTRYIENICVADCLLDEGESFVPEWLYYAIIVVVIMFLITLGFYILYRCRNNENPREYAIKRSWPWWIIVFLISVILFHYFGGLFPILLFSS